jgi:hypothetical protein
MNKHSSRSHTTVIIETYGNENEKIKRLFITDLVGSENCEKSDTKSNFIQKGKFGK